ncbi:MULTISPECIES: hypothetical protein [Mycolicibacterium]|jgi:hypothetical protein|uniref:Uncharacterized protein n=3 Tax=Mycolicibacterium TaxID=1866885 RepID=A0A378T2Y0_9MYCO|nr:MULTISPECIES: hypothetical protein [Mycolicibacterium]KLI07943.1 hypothetical protein AA982_12640 [Mycolicibacterium senegalense]KLO48195.1 hypothetical protein ABW05_26095 [Mycolicibacterium senegalense]KMV20636.1 hypothetical protein ACT17_03045 [Mycolicibacterium conceptionense]MCV7333408.1 hypothetical protein [Mycolicibacterium senegalense]MCW1821035.1 hypothetical protein [Mycolicibacterium senegalense]
MASGSGRHSWRRVVTGAMTGGALAVGLLAGVGAPTAAADPAEPTPQADAPAPRQMTADEALAIIAKDYDTGEGGGQISTLIHDILKLRQQGYKPSNANREAITEALDKRPNQVPLINALKSTLSYQRKLQAQSQAQLPQQSGLNPGVGQFPGGIAPIPGGAGVQPGPSGGIQIPLG